jgi:hypothetical protein
MEEEKKDLIGSLEYPGGEDAYLAAML